MPSWKFPVYKTVHTPTSYAARIIYHSGAHKPESIFQEITADRLPQTHEELVG